MRIRPTELGWKGLVLFVALEVAFFATSYSNLFFLVIAFSCVLGAMGLLGAMRNVRDVRAGSVSVPLAAAGEMRTCAVRLQPTRRSFDIDVGLDIGGAPVGSSHLAMLAGEQIVPLTLPGVSRGLRPVRGLIVTSCFPFGLLRVSRRLSVDVSVVTYPAPSLDGVEHALLGKDEAAVSGAARSNTVAALRPHRSGDELRDVHWKATARRGGPVVRERETEGGDEIELVLDRRCSGDVFERALADAAAVVLAALAAERALTLRSQGVTLRANAANGERDPLLRWLAAAQPVADGAPVETAGRSRGRLIALPRQQRVCHA